MKNPIMILLLALAVALGACSDDDNENNTSQNNTLGDTSTADTASDTSGGEDSGAEDTGGTEDTGAEDTGAEDSGGTGDTGGEDTGNADAGQDVEDDAGTTNYCTGGSSCRGIEKLPASVPQVCNNTPGCSYDNATQECQGTPEFTECASIDNEADCTALGCTATGQGDSFACAQPATNPPIQCEMFESPDARTGCTLYGCAYDGPTEGECSAPSQGFLLECSQFHVDPTCTPTDPNCCAYWASSQRGNLCGLHIPRGSNTEVCGPGQGMEQNCTNISLDECESRDGCSINPSGPVDYCQGQTQVICEDLTGAIPGQEGNFSQDCKAFGCDWQWTN
jgi:hypothetical protein